MKNFVTKILILGLLLPLKSIKLSKNYFNVSVNSINPGFDIDEPDLYWINSTNVENAWSLTTGDPLVKVGIIDGGILGTHEMLSQNFDSNLSKKFEYIPSNTNDGFVNTLSYNTNQSLDSHASHCAGIACGTNRLSVNDAGGIANNCKIVSLDVYDDEYNINLKCVKAAIEYAETIGIDILSMSLGWTNNDLLVKEAIENFSGLLVCSAGNNNWEINNQTNHSYYPAMYELDNVIVVGNLDNNNESYVNTVNFSGSSYSSQYVHLYAPGVNINSASNESTFAYSVRTGTSMAAPMVAGALALLKSYKPRISTTDMKSSILQNVTFLQSLSNKCITSGKLNIYNSLNNYSHTSHEYVRYGSLNRIVHKKICWGCNEYIQEPHYVYSGSNRCIKCGDTVDLGFVVLGLIEVLENE